MTFKVDHHNKILTILECLDCEVLKKGSTYFGGGTLLALDFEEYRSSKDVDFIASVTAVFIYLYHKDCILSAPLCLCVR